MNQLETQRDFECYWAHHGPAIAGKCIAEHVIDISDAELERCLGECVCGNALIAVARWARDNGLLTMDALLRIDAQPNNAGAAS